MDGTVREFPLPAPSREPLGIVKGPNGALWFGERGPSAIARIAADGSVREFPAPAEVGGLAVGSDGAIWFTGGRRSNTIGRMTTDGKARVVAELPGGGPCWPRGVVAGPDAALWFTLFGCEPAHRAHHDARLRIALRDSDAG